MLDMLRIGSWFRERIEKPYLAFSDKELVEGIAFILSVNLGLVEFGTDKQEFFGEVVE
jgi:hypothetical protein